MKATGIVRRIDDLGRVVVPKEIRRTMRIREGQAMEIYTGREGEIILKKYSPIEELAECAAGFTKSISTVTGCLVCVSDQEQIVAANGPEQKNYLGKSISSRLEEAILNRKTVLARPGEKAYFSILENTDNTTPLPELIFPILSSGDAIGSVILCGKDRESLPGDTEKKLLQVGPTNCGGEMQTKTGDLSKAIYQRLFASSAPVMQEAFSCYSVIRDIPILSCYLHLHCLQ